MAERRYVDFGSNLTGKLYLAKFGSSGAGVEIQVTIGDYSMDGGDKKFTKKSYLGSNYAMNQGVPDLVTLKITADSDKNSVDLLEILNGDATVSDGVSTIVGGGEQSYYRLIYVSETKNPDTGKTESRRWTWENYMGSANTIKFPAEDVISFSIELTGGLTDYKFEQTLDKDTHPLPSIPDYD